MEHTPNDPAVIVKGLVTDPLRSGYQVLWNYENIYWRALVGNDIWGLYEVLRGFCRQGGADTSQQAHQADCWPRISTLAAILGLKERRVLTGYKKTIKGKTYYYQGWIEILQQHDLIIVPDPGHDAQAEYRFTVNLTPKLLTPEQMAKLPKTLQTKHQALIDRCRQNLAKLKAQRRPAKFVATEALSEAASAEERLGKLPRGVGKLPRGVGKLPNKQKITNIIHKTTTTKAAEEGSQPPPSKPATNPVVVALQNLGFQAAQAKKLAKTAQQNDIDVGELIAFMDDKRHRDPESVKDPKAWLTTGIQRGYDLSVWYEHKAAKENEAEAQRRQAEERRRHQAQVEQQVQEQQAAHQQSLDHKRQEETERLAQLQAEWGSGDREKRLWQQVLSDLQTQLNSTMGYGLLERSALLSVEDGEVVMAVPNAWTKDYVSQRLFHTLCQALERHLEGQPVKLQLISPDPAPAPSLTAKVTVGVTADSHPDRQVPVG